MNTINEPLPQPTDLMIQVYPILTWNFKPEGDDFSQYLSNFFQAYCVTSQFGQTEQCDVRGTQQWIGETETDQIQLQRKCICMSHYQVMHLPHPKAQH